MRKLTYVAAFIFWAVISFPVQAQSVNWTPLSDAQELASEEGKKVMIFAEAEWCGYCKKMYQKVFPQQSVQDSLHKYFYPVRIDVESNEEVTFNGQQLTEKNLSRRFRVSSTPTIIFLNSDGDIIGTQPGYLPTNVFDKLLAFVGMDLTGTVPFKQYLNEHGVKINE